MSKYTMKKKKEKLKAGKKNKTISFNDDELLLDLLNGTITWDYISKEANKLKATFIEKYKDKLKWDIVSENKDLTSAFISKYSEYIDWNIVCKKGHITNNIFESFFEELYTCSYFDCIFENDNAKLDDNILDKYSEYFGQKAWIKISGNYAKKLSNQFIQKYKDKIYWKGLCRYKNNIDDTFINKFYNYIAWNRIYLDSTYLSDKCKYNIIYPKISTSDIINEFVLEDDKIRMLAIRLDRPDLWNYVSTSCVMTEEFIEKYKNKLNINNLKRNRYIKNLNIK